MSPKETPLKSQHEKAGGKLVDFAGWLMPVQYDAGLRSEHLNVRSNVGLFDVSHMGEIFVRGPKALETLEWVTTNHVGKLKAGEAQYSLFCNEKGGIVDDLIVYCLKPNEEYLLCVNASNTDKDFEWVKKNNKGAEVTNESSKWGQIAVQGPRAVELTAKILGDDVKSIPGFNFKAMKYGNAQVMVAATGYTGEAGFEIFVPWSETEKLWIELMDKGIEFGVMPIGLGARDTLRTEMKYSLYGHEIDDTTNPLEAGLGWVVKPDQKDFIGKSEVLKVKEKGVARKLIGFVMMDKAPARQGYRLMDADKNPVGVVTSGTPSPSRNDNIGVGYVRTDLAKEGQELFVEVRQRFVPAKIVKTPFVNQPKK